MKKGIITSVSILLLCIIVFFFLTKKKAETPFKISFKNCFWVGGKDGGYWVEILKFNNKDSIIANLYSESSGDSVGRFIYLNSDENQIKQISY